MTDVYSLLKIDHELLKGFHLQANRVENMQTERNLRQQVKTLKQIEERAMSDGGLTVTRQSVQEIIDKVKDAVRSGQGDAVNWTARELRVISYYLIKLQGDDEVFHYALRILDDGWRNLFLNGLAFFLLNCWCGIKPNLRRATCKLFTKRLDAYKGTNRRVMAWKNHANYFDDAGPLRLLQLLLSQDIDIMQAPSILGYKESALAQTFYSDVIIGYTQNKPIGLTKLEMVFEKHNYARTKKLILADYVEKSDRRGDAEKQTYLSNFINKTLGDVTLATTWAPFPGATAEEAQRLKHAMQLAKKWFARKIIETFFKICVQDKQREQFWLRYVQNISGFRIVGSSLIKQALRNDPSTREMFMPFFIDTNSRSSQTSALILSIKNKVMIEFSDVGALYVYNEDNVAVSFLRNGWRRIVSTSDLKTPSMDNLVSTDSWGYFTYYEEEGKMKHQGYWSSRLDNWMKQKVLTEDNKSESFFDCKDSGKFTAQPFTEEEPILTD